MLRWLLFTFFVCFFCFGWGDALGSSKSRKSYEDALLQRALKATHLQRDSSPKGKRVVRIVLYRENIIGAADPLPLWVNIVHVKTRESTIRQELLIQKGAVWNSALVAESERNLRALRVLSVSRLIPCLSAKSEQVVLLVVTKDLWSLRTGFGLQLNGGLLRSIYLAPTERNLFGLNKMLGISFQLNQFDLFNFSLKDSFSIAQFYQDSRLFGSRYEIYEQVKLIFDGDLPCGGAIGKKQDVWCPNRGVGTLSGGSGFLRLRRPLFSLASKWAFLAEFYLSTRRSRSFRHNRSDKAAPLGERQGLSLRTTRFEHSDGVIRVIPRVYDFLYSSAVIALTRSYGHRYKHNVTGGLAFYHQVYDVPENFSFGDDAKRWFLRRVLPKSESAVYAYVRYNIRPTNYIRLRNISTFALTEDFLIGPQFSFEMRVAQDVFRFSQFFFRWFGSAYYRGYLKKNLLTISLKAATRYQPRINEIGYGGPWVNSYLRGSVKHISPLLLFGRLHSRVYLYLRGNDLDRSLFLIGGYTGLRGYAGNEFEGQQLLQYNVEFRTLPISLFTMHAGLVAFYDGANLWSTDSNGPNGVQPLRYRHSVGVGLRTLFPQFNRTVFRVDVGIPLSKGAGQFLTWFSLAVGQVF